MMKPIVPAPYGRPPRSGSRTVLDPAPARRWRGRCRDVRRMPVKAQRRLAPQTPEADLADRDQTPAISQCRVRERCTAAQSYGMFQNTSLRWDTLVHTEAPCCICGSCRRSERLAQHAPKVWDGLRPPRSGVRLGVLLRQCTAFIPWNHHRLRCQDLLRAIPKAESADDDRSPPACESLRGLEPRPGGLAAHLLELRRSAGSTTFL